MSESLQFVGCIAVLGGFALLAHRCKTVLLGLSGFNIFLVATAMLSGFFISVIFGEPLDWLSDEHARVVTYGICGVLAMTIGVYVAWAPLRASTSPLPALHFNEKLGWITFWVGATFEIAYPMVAAIPTISTAVSSLSGLARIGLFILLWDAMRTRRWQRFALALAVFGATSVTMSLATGFSFLRIDVLLPLLLIWLFHRGITWRVLLMLPAAMLALLTTISAWLQTRYVIRGGSLEGLPLGEKIATFFSEYFYTLSQVKPDHLVQAIFERVDMTSIFAQQVAYQPDMEPYAHGETVLSSFYTLIPRVLWSEKPQVAGGSDFVARFSGISRPFWDETSVGLPYPFELYANGGPWLVVAGLAIIGYVAGRMELGLLRKPTSLARFWALAIATVVVCDGGQRTDVVLPTLVASVLCAYALGWFIEKLWPKFVANAVVQSASQLSRSAGASAGLGEVAR